MLENLILQRTFRDRETLPVDRRLAKLRRAVVHLEDGSGVDGLALAGEALVSAVSAATLDVLIWGAGKG
jgi:hypothetical protein